MAGFLEALGRSGALPALTRDVVGTWGGLQRLEFERERAQREREMFPIEKQYAQTRQALGETQLQQAQNTLQEQQKHRQRMESEMDITTHPMFLQLSPQGQKRAVQFFSSQGFTDTAGKGKTENVLFGMQMIENTSPLFQSMMGPEIEFKRQNVLNAYQEWQDAIPSGNEKKIAQAQQKYNQLNMQYQISNNAFEKHFQLLQNRDVMESQIRRLQESEEWEGLPTPIKMAIQNAHATGDMGEFNRVLTEWVKAEVKPPKEEKAPTKTEVLMGTKGTPAQRRQLIKGEVEIKETEKKPGDFDKKWAIATKIAKERNPGAVPTEEQIADAYKQKFGSADLLSILLGTTPVDPLGINK